MMKMHLCMIREVLVAVARLIMMRTTMWMMITWTTTMISMIMATMIGFVVDFHVSIHKTGSLCEVSEELKCLFGEGTSNYKAQK